MDWHLIALILAFSMLIYIAFVLFLILFISKKYARMSLESSRKINAILDGIEEELMEIKDRLTFLEASNIFTIPVDSGRNTARSEAAKEMWKRRRQRKIEDRKP
jgi:hypothetical protein